MTDERRTVAGGGGSEVVVHVRRDRRLKKSARWQRQPDGSILLRNPHPLRETPANLIAPIRKWAAEAPDRIWLGKRKPAKEGFGAWDLLTYAEANARVNAIAQALLAGTHDDVRRIILTASGGPFRGRSRESLRNVTPEEALAHPTWSMGPVGSTNSATLMNKGLEVIEAHLLFNVPYADIEVVVHPQSIVHSMVEFVDGSPIAQPSPPDMRLPISLRLAWPHRVSGVSAPLDWTRATAWGFEPLDREAFPAVDLAKQVGRAGGTFPAVYNAANEEAVDAFLSGRIGFLDIVDTVRATVDAHEAPPELTLETLADAERWARERAQRIMAA